MSEELAQDDEDAEDYDPESLELRNRGPGTMDDDDDDDDAATLVGGRVGGRRPDTVNHDDVVFEIGDGEDDAGSDDEEDIDKIAPPQKNRSHRPSSLDLEEGESQGLMRRDRND